jgi:acyl-CoA dehydrogenase
MIDFELTEKQRALQTMARDFALREIKPLNDKFEDDWATHKYMWQVLKKAAEIGLLGMPIEPEYGGGGASGLEIMPVLEELAAVNGGVATVIGDTWFAQTPIIIAATDEQRERWLRPLASPTEPNLAAILMTEPASGADIESERMELRTCKVILKEDRDELVLNGTKAWASNTGISFLYVVICTTNPNLGAEGSAMVVVEKDTPGMTFGKVEHKMGMAEDHNREVYFDNCRVPRKNLLGKIGGGHRLLQRTVMYNRLGSGMISVGIARGAFDYSLDYAKTRVVGGKRLIDHSLIQAMFADMATKIDAARLLVYRSNWANRTRHPMRDVYSNMAKVFGTNVAMEVTTNCVQLCGSSGYCKDLPLEKYMRDAKIVQIFLGPNELLNTLIGWRLGGSQ